MKRNEYGMLLPTTPEDIALLSGAKKMISEAAIKRKIEKSFEDMEWVRISSAKGTKRIGNASVHEIYDVTSDGKKVLVCVRDVEGTKYGQKTTSKTYYLIEKHGKGVRVVEADKSIAAKVAKQSESNLGNAIFKCGAKAKIQKIPKRNPPL